MFLAYPSYGLQHPPLSVTRGGLSKVVDRLCGRGMQLWLQSVGWGMHFLVITLQEVQGLHTLQGRRSLQNKR